MPNQAIVDTSLLIAFEKLNKLDLLCSVYDELLLTAAVFQEFSSEMVACFTQATAPNNLSTFLIHNFGLGRGESESISLAHSTGIRILLDDMKARKIAIDLGCRVSGTIGVLCKMEDMEFISSAYDEVLKLKGFGFRVSDKLIEKIRVRP